MNRRPRLPRWLYAGGSRRDRLRDPDVVASALRVKPGDIVGDLGPAYGHFTVLLARAVAPDGVVYAIDADQSTLDDLRVAADERNPTTLRTVLVPRDRLEIPEPVDLLFVSATYHHLRDPARYFSAARVFVRPGGRVAILESRREGLLAQWMGTHGGPSGRVRAVMAEAGFLLTATHELVPGHWFGQFQVRPQP
ncbi:MAG: methyltransferase domain-containing protein [Chloroflexi bacterium]|nr:methyltransferase domain-containing protein [Chloroflexota bacterium]